MDSLLFFILGALLSVLFLNAHKQKIKGKNQRRLEDLGKETENAKKRNKSNTDNLKQLIDKYRKLRRK